MSHEIHNALTEIVNTLVKLVSALEETLKRR